MVRPYISKSKPERKLRIKTEREGGVHTLSFNDSERYIKKPSDVITITVPNVDLTSGW